MKYTNDEIRAMIAQEIDGIASNTMFSPVMSIDMMVSFDEFDFSIVFLISDGHMNLRGFDVYNDTWNYDATDSIDFVDSSLDLNMQYIMQCFNDANVELEKHPNESHLYIVDTVKKAVYLADSNTVPMDNEVLIGNMEQAINIMPSLV